MQDKDIKKILKSKKPEIEEKFKVDKLGLFGSYIKDQADESSDIDLLVEFSEPVSFFTFIDLEDYLNKELNKEIDLVSKKALKEHIGKRILNEVSYL